MAGQSVAFEGLIKQVNIKSLVSGDKQARITIDIDSPPDEMIDNINRLHRADQLVAVAIAELEK